MKVQEVRICQGSGFNERLTNRTRFLYVECKSIANYFAIKYNENLEGIQWIGINANIIDNIRLLNAYVKDTVNDFLYKTNANNYGIKIYI